MYIHLEMVELCSRRSARHWFGSFLSLLVVMGSGLCHSLLHVNPSETQVHIQHVTHPSLHILLPIPPMPVTAHSATSAGGLGCSATCKW